MKPTIRTTNRRGALQGALFLALLASLSLSPAAIAGKGGNGGGKPGGEDPPADPAPVKYELRWIQRDGYETRIRDINSSGIATGHHYLTVDNVVVERVPIVVFPDGREVELGPLLSSRADYPTDPDPTRQWTLERQWCISDEFEVEHEDESVSAIVVSGDLHDPDGRIYAFAAQLADNGPGSPPDVHWFRWLTAVDVGAPAHLDTWVWDSSAGGELGIEIKDPAEGAHRRTYVWSPRANLYYGPWTGAESGRPMINSSGQILIRAQDRVINYLEGTEYPVPEAAQDIADDGTLVGSVADVIEKGKNRGTVAAPARFVSGGWEPLAPFSGDRSYASNINSLGDIIGYAGERFFLYLNDGITGLTYVDDLIDPDSDPTALAIWAGLEGGLSGPSGTMHEISDPDDSGHGWIAGSYNLGERPLYGTSSFAGFILRPIAVPAP